MNITQNLFIVGGIILLGLMSQIIFKKTKIPEVLPLIIVGIILKYFNYIPEIDKKNNLITFLIILSLIYVVFYGALTIRIKAIISTMKYAFIYSIVNFILITLIIGFISLAFGFTLASALSLGALFCVLDGSIINSILETIKVSKRAEAQIQSESAITDILVIVGILSLINFSNVEFSQILSNLSNYFLLSFAIGFFCAIIWSMFMKYAGSLNNSVPITTMAVLVMIYAYAEYIGANGTITIFSFSIILGNFSIISDLFYSTKKSDLAVLDIHTKSFFKDISFLIRTFLFVYLGVLIDFNNWIYLIAGLLFFIISYIIRGLILNLIYNNEITKKENLYLETMCAKGLTATVLLTVTNSDNIFSNIVIGGVISSVIISSILIFFVNNDKYNGISKYIKIKT